MQKLFHSNAPSWPRRATRIALWLLLLIVVIGVVALIGFRIAAQYRETLEDDQGAPPGGRFILSGDVKLFVQESGPVNGVPVVFIAGTGAWSETWRDTLNALAAKGYRCIALDLPPFGYSQRPADRDYSTPRQAQRIAGLLDALGIQGAVLVGHSFGSRATMQLALSAPQRVRAVALVDAALTVNAPPHAGQPLPWPMRWSPLRDGVIASTATNPLMTHFFLEQFTARHEVLTPARVDLYRQAFARRGTTAAFGLWATQFGEPTNTLLSADPAAYRKLDIPTLLLWGERDTVTPLAQGQQLATLLPRADLQILPDAGHIPQIETPEAFNARLLTFLGKPELASPRISADRPAPLR